MSSAPARGQTRVLARRYELQERLGAGGAGTVWRAHDRTLDRTVAVKLLRTDLGDDESAAARFRAEASAAAKLTHPNAVVVYDIGRDGDDDYIVMEHVQGRTLGDVLREGPLPAAVAAAVAVQVGRALGTAHGRGLVHRDVKPANVLVTEDGTVKVADFGIARALGEGSSRLTTTGAVMGTARYLAPEQLRDEPVDGRADVYALGLLLHECLTGELPFGDGSAVEVAMRRLSSTLPSLHGVEGVPDGLAAAVARATDAASDGRYEDGAAFAAALGPFVAPDAARRLAARVSSERPDAPASSETRRLEAHPVPTATAATTATVATTPVRTDAPPPSTAPHQPATGSDPSTAGDRSSATVATRTDRSATTDRYHPSSGTTDAADPQRGRGLAIVAVLLFLLTAGWTLTQVLGAPGSDEATTAPAPGADGPPAATEGEVVEIVAGGDHDPEGSGEEHPDRVVDAFDGDETTFWRTQRYRGDPALGGLKPGVGIWLELAAAGPIGEVTVVTTEPGADLTVYVGTGAPDAGASPDAWGTAVGSLEDAAVEGSVVPDEPLEGDTVLVWLTSLPPDGDGWYRGTIAEVRVTRP